MLRTASVLLILFSVQFACTAQEAIIQQAAVLNFASAHAFLPQLTQSFKQPHQARIVTESGYEAAIVREFTGERGITFRVRPVKPGWDDQLLTAAMLGLNGLLPRGAPLNLNEIGQKMAVARVVMVENKQPFCSNQCEIEGWRFSIAIDETPEDGKGFPEIKVVCGLLSPELGAKSLPMLKSVELKADGTLGIKP